MATEPVQDVREISRIAHGFVGSKPLFSALEVNLFTYLSSGRRTGQHRPLPWPAQRHGLPAGNLLQRAEDAGLDHVSLRPGAYESSAGSNVEY